MKKYLLLACMAIFLSSCIMSLHPLYTPDTTVYKKEVMNTWVDADKNKWMFMTVSDLSVTVSDESEDEKVKYSYTRDLTPKNDTTPRYLLYYTPFDEKGEKESIAYVATLVQLGTHYFFDLYPFDMPGNETNQLVSSIPTHNFLKVTFNDNDQMELQMFDIDYMRKLFEQRQIRIRHEVLENGEIVLSASTEELQRFFVKYADDERVFEAPSILSKVNG